MRNFECPSMQRGESPNYNNILKTFVCSAILADCMRSGNFTQTYLCTRRTRKCFQGAVVNRAYPSLNEGSLEITLSVPFKM